MSIIVPGGNGSAHVVSVTLVTFITARVIGVHPVFGALCTDLLSREGGERGDGSQPVSDCADDWSDSDSGF